MNGGFPWLEVKCSRCKTPSSIDLAAISRPQDTNVHLLEGRLDRTKCRKAWRNGTGSITRQAVDRSFGIPRDLQFVPAACFEMASVLAEAVELPATNARLDLRADWTKLAEASDKEDRPHG